jgi:hypothetical protein
MKEDEKFLAASLKESMHKNKLVRSATDNTKKCNDALKGFFKQNMPEFNINSNAQRYEQNRNLNKDMSS